MLLEDRDDFRSVLHDYLVSRSYQVTSVRSGVEGLREITKDTFDLILCDMMMPQGGGEMFYWAVTRVRLGAGRRFIFFTGHQNNPAQVALSHCVPVHRDSKSVANRTISG